MRRRLAPTVLAALPLAALLLAAVARGGAAAAEPWPPPAAACAADYGADRDGDGLPDECEARLAAAFAPELLADREDCLWDSTASGGAHLRGGYLYVVAPLERGRVRIAYLPAYFRDCGWGGVARVMRFGRSDAHDGDSELIVLDLAPGPGPEGLEVGGVFLSAHCGGRAGGDCRWFRGRALNDFAWTAERRLGAPRVWVSTGKHAHYRSRGDCDRGHWRQEGCADRPVAYRFPVVSPAQNIGSRARPAGQGHGCVVTEALPLGAEGAAPGAMECLWSEWTPFRGWQAERTGEAPTPYARLLRTHAGL